MKARFYRLHRMTAVVALLIACGCVSESDVSQIQGAGSDSVRKDSVVVTLEDGASCERVACIEDNDCPDEKLCLQDPECEGDNCSFCRSTRAEGCESGFCVNGVCCEMECQGLCMACSATLTGGNNGECRPVSEGTDPQDECVADETNVCGFTGYCSGLVFSAGESNCQVASTDVLCDNASCTGGDTYSAAYCNGVGACGNGALVEQCGFFGCDEETRASSLVFVEQGTFALGSPSAELGRDNDEVQRDVTLTRSFVIATTEVSQGQWLQAFPNNPTPTNSNCLDCPVEYVTFWEALSYANYLSLSEGLTPCYILDGCSSALVGQGKTCSSVSFQDSSGTVSSPYACEGYRLPSEVEWEIAARAGTTTAIPSGINSSQNLNELGWFTSNASSRAHAVGTKLPNPWGIFDLFGNSKEWVGDLYGTYGGSAVTDPIGATQGDRRVVRGGSWQEGEAFLRSASRSSLEQDSRSVDLGFRVAKTVHGALPQPSVQAPANNFQPSSGFVRLGPGTFTMGALSSYPERLANQLPAREVALSYHLEVQEHEVTQAEFLNAFGVNPSQHYDCLDCPVDSVSFWDALHYANDLSLQAGLEPCYALSNCSGLVGVDRVCSAVTLTGRYGTLNLPQYCEGYRLPTEAEWEYLARGGATTAFTNNRDIPSSGLGWTSDNATTSREVKTRSSNALGIYDVHGNVREWTWDRLRDDIVSDRSYSRASQLDPVGPAYHQLDDVSFRAHAVRGGSFLSAPEETHLAYRDGELPNNRARDLGFRLVRTAPFEDWSDGSSTGTFPTCDGGCQSDEDCDVESGSWCQLATQTCVQGERDGGACTRDSECGSGECVDGVCCASSCDAGCFSCNQGLTGQASGVCAPVLAGVSRGNDCAAGIASECGLDGTCDGAGECRFYQDSTVCVGAMCTLGAAVGNRYCNGAGMCTEPVSYDACQPYACDGRSASCRSVCSQDADCASGVLASGRREFRCHDESGECTDQSFLGEVCAADSQCVSGNCVDGVCCDTACDSLCESCLQNETGIQSGTCSPIVSGTDPGAECSQQPRSSCGTAGYCDGAGACSLYSKSTVCLGAYCDGDDRLNASRCDGEGTCLEPTNRRSCAPYTCAGSACLSNCDGNEDCASGYRCQTTDSVCTDLSFIGESCGGDAQCYSGQCVDGVCCESACEGECLACSQSKTGESNGLCRNVNLGSDPDNECRDDGAASCGLNGACGSGGCALYASGTECAPEICIGDDLFGVRSCDGSGSCSEARDLAQDCGAYTCSGASCLSACADDASCANGYRCASADGVCTDKSFVGESCGRDNQCYSGSCVDGVCCESACGGTCEACSGAKTGQADGTCAPIVSGSDPDNECSREAVATCGQTGVCDGARACAVYPASATCRGSYCSGDTRFAVSRCDGSGTCGSPESSTSCAPYTCSGGGCLNSCSDTGDCASGYRCQTDDGVCTTKKFRGETCSGANQCYSGYCVDGVCCDQQCGGTCMACNGAQTGAAAGTCSPVLDGQSTGECSAQSASSCGLDGTCNGAGGCAYHDSGTQCGAATCSSGNLYNPRACNGSGTCLGATLDRDCGFYNCYSSGGNVLCRNSCSNDSHCDSAAGAWCNTATNQCVTGKRPGETCSSNGQCGTGVCNDGVCCQTSCNGTCYSCNGSYTGTSSGVCAPVSSGRSWGDCSDQGALSCGQNGTCNGSGGCTLYSASTVCGEVNCSGGDLYAAALCNGTGSCRAPTKAQECGSYACLNDACRSSCTSNGHCATGYRCYTGNNTCTTKKLNGESCSGPSQCASGKCVDGVCCESSCNSTCEACIQSKTGASNGLCRAIRSGNDYDNECADRSCSGDLRTAYSASTCSNRSCSSQTATSCGVYKCNTSTSACRTSCSRDSHCQPEAPTCIGGVCTSNRAPSGSSASFTVDEMGSVNVNLYGSDPDGDSLTFGKRYENGVSVSWRNKSTGAITITATTCGDSGSFQYRVKDSKGLSSPWYSVSVSIRNLKPSLSTNGNKSGGYGEKLYGHADFSDCGSEANCSRTSVWRHSGVGTVSKTSCSGTRVSYSWQPNRASQSEFCNGPTANHRRQEAEAKVRISDGQSSRTQTVTFTAAAAQKCDDQCVSRPWWLFGACLYDEIRPTGCGYCQAYTRTITYCARYEQRCRTVRERKCRWRCKRWSCGWDCWTEKRQECWDECVDWRSYQELTGKTSCNDQSSVRGFFSSVWNWILDVLGFSNPGPWCLR